MKKNILICILCMLSLFLYMRGNALVDEPELRYYIEFSSTQDELLQIVYDNDPDFFNDILMETDAYYKLDSLINNPY